MIAKVNGVAFFLSAAEKKRLTDKTKEDLLQRMKTLSEWIETAEPQDAPHQSAQAIDNTVDLLLEDLDAYYQLYRGYVHSDVLRRGFERDDRGHRIENV